MRVAAGKAGLVLGALACVGIASGAAVAGPQGARDAGLIGLHTGPEAELRETVPVASVRGAEPRSVLTLPLPRLRRGDEIRFNAEVTLTTTCVEPVARCIGERYAFDPRMGARIFLARRAGDVRGSAVSDRVALRCQQTRPNRNHHCPLVIGRGRIAVERTRDLPCPRRRCRLNMVVDVDHPNADGGEVVIVGADRPDGSVDQGKARLSAAITRAGAMVRASQRTTRRRLARRMPSSGAQTAIYSQRILNLHKGDVLMATARQRTAISDLPYFVASKIIFSTRPGSTSTTRLARRIVSREATATEPNGFNCTPGPSAFQTPCTTKKAGLAVVHRRPRRADGRPVRLYAVLVSRSFGKRVQARGSFPPARVLAGGRLTVRHLVEGRADE